MRLRIPPPILMLLAAGLMWTLDQYMPLAQWIAHPWNRLGGLLGAVGIVIDVAAFLRFRKSGTTVNPLDPNKASHLVTDGVFRVHANAFGYADVEIGPHRAVIQLTEGKSPQAKLQLPIPPPHFASMALVDRRAVVAGGLGSSARRASSPSASSTLTRSTGSRRPSAAR